MSADEARDLALGRPVDIEGIRHWLISHFADTGVILLAIAAVVYGLTYVFNAKAIENLKTFGKLKARPKKYTGTAELYDRYKNGLARLADRLNWSDEDKVLGFDVGLYKLRYSLRILLNATAINCLTGVEQGWMSPGDVAKLEAEAEGLIALCPENGIMSWCHTWEWYKKNAYGSEADFKDHFLQPGREPTGMHVNMGNPKQAVNA